MHVDESGNSGQNLLDAQQPVFVLAAVHLGDADASRLASMLAGGADEAHYTRMRKRPGGQERILQVVGDSALAPDSVRVSALHKPFMAVAKLVDLLLEPIVAAAGRDLYADGSHLELSNMLFALGPDACPRSWQPLMESFVRFVWRGTSEGATRLSGLLAQATREAEHHPVGELLEMMPHDERLLLAWHGREDGDDPADALDPALAATVEQARWWGTRLGPFLLVYDESKLVGRWSARLLALSDPAVAAEYAVTPTNRMPALPLAGLAPAISQDSPAVQVADLLAGACADVLRGRMLQTTPTAWHLRLRQARVLRFVDHLVWPGDTAVADEFELQGCLGEE